MKYTKYELDNLDVHFIKTDKFKSIYISMVLINEFNKENLTKNFILRKLLTTSSKNLKNEIEVTTKVCDLYNSGIVISNNLVNNVITTNIDMEVLEDKYTEDGLLNKALDYYFDTIFNPNIIDGKFEKSNYDLVIKNVSNYYEKEKENKRRYAVNNAFSILDENQLKYNINGYIEDLKNITSETMADYYENLFKSAHANIFVIGNVNEEELLQIIKDNIKDKLYKNPNKYEINVFKNNTKLKTKEDKDNNNQSILVLIYKILNITKRERYVILPVFNRIFGLGNNSKLFRNVREKNSLCYDIRSSVFNTESIMTVESGINYSDKDKVIELINIELENMKNGNITQDEFNDAIKFRKKNLKQFEDYNDSILYIKQGKILFDNEDLEERRESVDTIKIDELSALANKIELNVDYILKGDKNE